MKCIQELSKYRAHLIIHVEEFNFLQPQDDLNFVFNELLCDSKNATIQCFNSF